MYRIRASFSLGREPRLRRTFTIPSYLQKNMFAPHLLHRKQLKSPNKPPPRSHGRREVVQDHCWVSSCAWQAPPGPLGPVPSPCWICELQPLLLPSGTSRVVLGPAELISLFWHGSVGTTEPALEELGLGRWLVTKNKCLQVNTVSSAGIK